MPLRFDPVVRELKNALESATLQPHGGALQTRQLPAYVIAGMQPPQPLD